MEASQHLAGSSNLVQVVGVEKIAFDDTLQAHRHLLGLDLQAPGQGRQRR